MLEIDEAIIKRIEDNTEIIDYLGGNTDDSRVYSWNPAFDIVYSNSTPGAIFYQTSLTRRGVYSYPFQRQNKFLILRVAHFSKTTASLISEKLIELFDYDENNYLETENYRVLRIDLSTYSDGNNEGTASQPIYIKNLGFSFSNIFKR